MAASKQAAPSGDDSVCDGCGAKRTAAHSRKTCYMRNFSDFNADESKSWKDSESARLLAARGKTRLEIDFCADGSKRDESEKAAWKQAMDKAPKKGGGDKRAGTAASGGSKRSKHCKSSTLCCALCNISHTVQVHKPIVHFDVSNNGKRISLTCLIDSGAMSDDYLTVAAAARLGEMGLMPTDVAPVMACGAIASEGGGTHHCTHVSQRVPFTCVFVDVVNNDDIYQHTFSVTPKIMNNTAKVDLILGYETLARIKLMHRFLPELFPTNLLDTPFLDAERSPKCLASEVSTVSVGGVRNLTGGDTDTSSVPFETVAEITEPSVNDDALTNAGKATKYVDEDVAFRDPVAPWESRIDDIRGTNAHKALIETLRKGLRGTARVQAGLLRLYETYIDVFDTAVRKTPAKVSAMKLSADIAKWKVPKNAGPARMQSGPIDDEIHRQVQNMLELNVIRMVDHPYYSQVLLVNKPGPPPQAKRFCIDYRQLNDICESLGWPIPNIQQMLQRIGDKKAKFFAKIDLTSGYHQAPLDEGSRWLSAFQTSRGTFEWLRVPMGMKCAGGTGPRMGCVQRSRASAPVIVPVARLILG